MAVNNTAVRQSDSQPRQDESLNPHQPRLEPGDCVEYAPDVAYDTEPTVATVERVVPKAECQYAGRCAVLRSEAWDGTRTAFVENLAPAQPA